MHRRAFTLVELLVVISIIGLLSTIAVVSLGSARVKARDVKRVADKTQIIKALQLYYEVNGGWPSAAGDWRCLGAPTTENCFGAFTGLDALKTAMSPYMANIPTTGADSGNLAYNRYLYVNITTIGTQTGAFLIWPKETAIAQADCPSAYAVQHPDKYWYCWEYLGP
jgi:prepilin-type N-terminal cleavage/methylation domain-containing protein